MGALCYFAYFCGRVVIMVRVLTLMLTMFFNLIDLRTVTIVNTRQAFRPLVKRVSFVGVSHVIRFLQELFVWQGSMSAALPRLTT